MLRRVIVPLCVLGLAAGAGPVLTAVPAAQAAARQHDAARPHDAASSAAHSASVTLPAASRGWHLSYRLPFSNGSTESVSSIAALSRNDAWAVGGRLGIVNHQGVGVPAIWHWNGSAWRPSALPRPQHEGFFTQVLGSSARNVWAFGSFAPQGLRATPYVAHWNGRTWAWLTRGRPGDIYAATVLGPSDVWGTAAVNQVEHWNGRGWRGFGVPGQGVQAFAGISPSDVWAIALNTDADQFEALRWNGHFWHQVPVPPVTLPAHGQSIPAAIVAASRDSVWAVGALGYPDPETSLPDAIPVAYHWNGTSWKLLAVPSSLYSGIKEGAAFTAIAPDGAGGFITSMAAGGQNGTAKLVDYRDGNWTVIALPAIKGSAVIPVPPTILGVTSVPGTREAWVPIEYINARSGQYEYSIYSYTS
ncbi:MAG: hypothetical protein ACLQFR_07680 [Streptosporangiaceae bacterium]